MQGAFQEDDDKNTRKCARSCYYPGMGRAQRPLTDISTTPASAHVEGARRKRSRGTCAQHGYSMRWPRRIRGSKLADRVVALHSRTKGEWENQIEEELGAVMEGILSEASASVGAGRPHRVVQSDDAVKHIFRAQLSDTDWCLVELEVADIFEHSDVADIGNYFFYPDHVSAFGQMDAATAPPVVLSPFFMHPDRFVSYELLDGLHRLHAARDTGQKRVRAYVPANTADLMEARSRGIAESSNPE